MFCEKVVSLRGDVCWCSIWSRATGVSQRQTCRVLEVARATRRYEGRPEQWIELRMRIREIAQTRVRYGHRMIRILLNRVGWKVGEDLVYRLYKEEGLVLRKRPAGRRRAVVHRQERFEPTGRIKSGP